MIIYDNAVSFIQMVKVSYCSIQSIDFRLLEKSMHLCISACVCVCMCVCVCVCMYHSEPSVITILMTYC